MQKTVDVAVIGAGSAGLSAVAQARGAGRSFTLINGGHLGTTCARVACMPSKALIQIAEDFHRRTVFDRQGIEGDEHLAINMEDVMERVRDLRDIFVDRVLAGSTDDMTDELIEGYAEFVEPNVLRVGEQIIRADKIVIATGSRPIKPKAWDDFGDKILTTDELFEQEDLPASMAIIGLGVIGLELGQALRRLGLEITGIDQETMIAGLSDPLINQAVIDVIGNEFPVWLGEAAHIEACGKQLRVTAGERSVVVDKVLASIGRTPNLDKLGLQNIGVSLNADGLPDYNPNTMQIGELPIFIAGDSTGSRPVVHEANEEGRIAGYNASHEQRVAFRRKTPLTVIFCDPNIASVGASWNELQHREDLVCGVLRFGPVGRALLMSKNKGVLRLYAEQGSGRLLGASMFAPKGENLAHLLAWAIEQEMTVFDLVKMPFYHPVIEEGLQAALQGMLHKLDNPTPGLPPQLQALD